MSIYASGTNLHSLYLSEEDWKRFLIKIQTSCRFDKRQKHVEADIRQLCDDFIYIRFYREKDIVHYHVSNDDRRKIVRYLGKVSK